MLRHIPVSIRARIYRTSTAATITATSAAGVLAALHYDLPAAIVAIAAGVLGSVSSALAAANTPVDFRS